MNTYTEQLTQSADSAALLRDHLRQSYAAASTTAECIVLEMLISDAATVENTLKRLLQPMGE